MHGTPTWRGEDRRWNRHICRGLAEVRWFQSGGAIRFWLFDFLDVLFECKKNLGKLDTVYVGSMKHVQICSNDIYATTKICTCV